MDNPDNPSYDADTHNFKQHVYRKTNSSKTSVSPSSYSTSNPMPDDGIHKYLTIQTQEANTFIELSTLDK